MSDDYGVQGLSGNEIVDDILAQLKKRLSGDCSLRPQDSYSRGYSAKITYSVRCYGLDEQIVEGEFDLGEDPEEPIEGGAEGELIIDQEEDISEVRERIADAKQEEVSSYDEEDAPIEIPTNEGTRQKRKYTRKLKLASSGIIGGAEDFKE